MTTFTKVMWSGAALMAAVVLSLWGAAGSTYVHVTNASGFNMTVRVINQYLGQPHAIQCAVLGSGGC